METAPHSLAPLFHPRSVAVIGASADPTKLGGRTFSNLKNLGYAGRLYPVNHRIPEVQGVATVATIADLPEAVDLAFVIVPAEGAVETLAACAARGVKAAVVFSSGFAEIGEQGRIGQERIAALARTSGMRILGPNCMGVMNMREAMYGSFTASFEHGMPFPGRIGVVSQSGAFGAHCFVLAREMGLGLSLWVTTGNECDLDVAECLAYLVEDPGTDVIVVYLEGVKRKAAMMAALENARRKRKPVVVLKVGRSDLGALAASSHTASLVGSDAVYDALFRQFGVHRAESIEKLMDIAYACTAGIFPTGRNIGLVTVSGGVGVLMADEAARVGLNVPALPEQTQQKIKAMLPYAAVRNPVDVTGQALADMSLVGRNLELMLAEGGCDAVVVFLAALGLSERLMAGLTDSLLHLRRAYPDGLVILSIMLKGALRQQLEAGGFLAYEDPGTAIEAVAVLHRFSEAFDRPPPAPPAPLPAAARPPPMEAPGEHEAMALLASAGIPVVEQRLARTPAEAAAAAVALGFPVVLKLASPDILHKSEMGGVLLGVETQQAVAAGFATLLERAQSHHPEARVAGVLVAPMVAGGVETIIGVNHDPVFGPVVMFGMGGVLVEVMQDVTLRLAPFNEPEAQAMIREIKGFPLLQGVRGRPPADLGALASALSALSVYAHAHQERLQSVEINPFLVLPQGQGALALDALMVLRGE